MKPGPAGHGLLLYQLFGGSHNDPMQNNFTEHTIKKCANLNPSMDVHSNRANAQKSDGCKYNEWA